MTGSSGTKDFLGLKYEHRQAERRWIEEKDHLLRELDKLKEVQLTYCSFCAAFLNCIFYKLIHN